MWCVKKKKPSKSLQKCNAMTNMDDFRKILTFFFVIDSFIEINVIKNHFSDTNLPLTILNSISN